MALDLGALFGDQSGAFNDYAAAMDAMEGKYNPFITAGTQGNALLLAQLKRLMANPTFVEDMASKNFLLSPYQKNLENTTQQAMNYNAANTGMLGSGAADLALQKKLMDMTGAFQNQYVLNALNSYGMGLQGLGQMANRGLNALDDQSSLAEQAAAAKLKAEQSQDASWSNLFGGILGGGIGYLSGGFPGMFKGVMRGFGNGAGNATNDMSGRGY